MSFFTYMVRCEDGTYYTGWTTDVDARVRAHNAGKGGYYTRARAPVTLVGKWQFDSKRAAMSFEWHVKQLTRQQKEKLLAGDIVQFRACVRA